MFLDDAYDIFSILIEISIYLRNFNLIILSNCPMCIPNIEWLCRPRDRMHIDFLSIYCIIIKSFILLKDHSQLFIIFIHFYFYLLEVAFWVSQDFELMIIFLPFYY